MKVQLHINKNKAKRKCKMNEYTNTHGKQSEHCAKSISRTYFDVFAKFIERRSTARRLLAYESLL